MTAQTAATWNRRLAAYAQPVTRRSVAQLALTFVLFCAAIAAAHMLHAMRPGLGLPLSAVAGTLIVRLFIVQHDCGHRSFFRSARACDMVGRALSLFTLTPYEFWRRDHDRHHATSGDLDRRGHGDISTLTVAEYRALPRGKRIAYRLYRHPAVMFGIGPSWQFLLRYRFPLGVPRNNARRKVVTSVLLHDATLVAFFGALSLLLGWRSVAAVWLPAILVAATLGVWLFYVQHAFEEAYWERNREWSFVEAALKGCSFYRLPRWAHWLTGSIGYHHVHHLASRIPNYRLAEAFAEIPELRQAPSFGVLESLRCARLSLWCEASGRLVSFRDARLPATA